MRTRLAALVAAAPLMVAVACGASGGTSEGRDDDTSAPPSTEAPTTTAADTEAMDLETWADAFCTSFGAWLDGINAASNRVGDDVTPGDVESGKTAIAVLFGEASSQTQTLIADVENAGYPDIEDGDQLREDLIARFEGFDEAALAAQSDAESLSVSDAEEFETQAEELTQRFETEVSAVADSFAQIDVDYPSAELTVAINTSCTF